MIQTLNVSTQINLVSNGHKKVKIESEKMETFLEIIKARHRNLYELLDTNLINDKDRMDLHCDEMSKITGHSDFDDETDGGRGRASLRNCGGPVGRTEHIHQFSPNLPRSWASPISTVSSGRSRRGRCDLACWVDVATSPRLLPQRDLAVRWPTPSHALLRS